MLVCGFYDVFGDRDDFLGHWSLIVLLSVDHRDFLGVALADAWRHIRGTRLVTLENCCAARLIRSQVLITCFQGGSVQLLSFRHTGATMG